LQYTPESLFLSHFLVFDHLTNLLFDVDNSLRVCIIIRINLDLIQVFVTRDSGYFSAGININLMMDENTTPAEGTEEATPATPATETPAEGTPAPEAPATETPAEGSAE